ncbi:MAG TPA: adenylyltransferase/cytidyltransferase family protein [Candidatus Saccharimonadales bacterium]|nr:adenylyltransferase/cytidyltransferase family protein [Candidatus Saccharimonadales bacterium]
MKIVILSGFFNPLHGGHLDMIEEAADMADKLIVIVNNDVQQKIKKGKIILDEQNRLRLIGALKYIDDAILAIDEDPPVSETIRIIAREHPNDKIIFANGGDRSSAKVVPEAAVCQEFGIKMLYGIGGNNKADSSTRINQATGHEVT